MNGVVHHERRDQSLGLRGVQPTGGQGDVHGVRQGSLGRGRRRGGAAEEQQQEQGSQRHGAEPESSHAILLVAVDDPALAADRSSSSREVPLYRSIRAAIQDAQRRGSPLQRYLG